MLQRLISEGEHQTQDFKHSISSQKKIAITLSAFANTDGGKLLIGVKDSGRIVGVHVQDELHMMEGAAEVFCKPEVSYSYQVHKHLGKEVLEFEIHPSREKPVLAKNEEGKWLAYLRVEDENFKADPVLLQAWRDGQVTRKSFIKYEKEDETILKLLENHPSITYKEVAKQSHIARPKIIHALAKLLRWEIIDYEVDEKGIYYYLL
jgi:predicted HTH transcriptional regulator